MYDANGNITRAGAMQAIQGGGSVSIGERIYASIESLPSEAAFLQAHKAAALASLERAKDIIADGGKVKLAGKVYKKGDILPTEAEFAKGDPQAEATAREKLKKQIQDAQAQLQTLDHSAKPATAKA